ncbi:hypothetical protein ACHAXT_008127 [Thalassiosira profunda]
MFSAAARSAASAAVRRTATRRAASTAARAAAAPAASNLARGLAAAAASAAAAVAYTNHTSAVQCAALPVQGAPGTNQERTFLAVKPDGVQRGLVGDIIARFEKRGYKLVGLKMVWPTEEMAKNHYKDLAKKPFYPGAKDIIAQGRQMLGETQPLASKPGSIRGDYSIDLGRNICHGSDSPESAAHELKMWFPEGVNDWKKTIDAWVYEG